MLYLNGFEFLYDNSVFVSFVSVVCELLVEEVEEESLDDDDDDDDEDDDEP